MSVKATPIRALQAANQRLHALRAALPDSQSKAGVQASHDIGSDGFSAAQADRDAQPFPVHLGWESAAVTAVLRRSHSLPKPASEPPLPESFPIHAAVERAAQAIGDAVSLPKPGEVRVHPSIGLGLLRANMAAAGRVWLLLRCLDEAGCGKLRIVNIRKTLCHKKSPLYLAGWRQLRNLLRQGDGLFWQRDKTWLWLRSAAKVSAGLGIERLTGRPVFLPAAKLLGGIGQARAYLYAAFHAGRQINKASAPIARSTLETLSGVGRRSQHAYERRAGVCVQRNLAVGSIALPDALQTRAWEQGTAVFELKDYDGRQGRGGKTYVAWQLPNSYHCEQKLGSQGSRRRVNRQLAGLLLEGTTGNGLQSIPRRYFPQGQAAAHAASRLHVQEIYWRRTGAVNADQLTLWHFFER